jgi:hypothetical protein
MYFINIARMIFLLRTCIVQLKTLNGTSDLITVSVSLNKTFNFNIFFTKIFLIFRLIDTLLNIFYNTVRIALPIVSL